MSDPVDSIDVDGRRRTYRLHLPPAVEGAAVPQQRLPLVIALHGRNINGDDLRRITHLDLLADRYGFAIAYPEGFERSWNDGRGYSPAERAGVDDVAFLRQLIDRVVERTGADPNRVVATGLSNGASMCHRLGLEASDRVGVIAAVAGTMPAGLGSIAPTHAVSVLLIHGTADRHAPIDGGPPRGVFARAVHRRIVGPGRGPYRPMLSLAATADRWSAIDRCTPTETLPTLPPTPRDPTSVDRTLAGGGHGGTGVASWIVRRGGHTWPSGGPPIVLGRTTRHFDAGEVIWQFASEHWRSAGERLLRPDPAE